MRLFQWSILLGLVVGITVGVMATELESTNIEIILDASGSMGEPVIGGVKIVVAKQAIEELLQILPPSYNVAFRLYGHRYPTNDRDRSCKDTELLCPLRPFTDQNRASIVQQLAPVQPKGLTPIAYALEEAVKDFTGMTGKNIIVMVSDGEETCGGDPLAVADYIMSLAIGLKVYVIGFDVSSKQQLEEIAVRTGGQYYDARNAVELEEVLKQVVSEATSVLFFDDFADVDQTNSKWSTTPAWRIEYGKLYHGWAEGARGYAYIPQGMLWDDYMVEVDVDCSHERAGIFFRCQENLQNYVLLWGDHDRLQFQVVVDHEVTAESEIVSPGFFEGTQAVKVIVRGTTYKVFSNGLLRLEFEDRTFLGGMPGLASFGSASSFNSSAKYDNFRVTRLE